MRKFMRFPPHTLRVRLLLTLAGALMLLAAFAPTANAALIRFYDFEGAPQLGYPVNLESHAPALETGITTQLFLADGTGAPYPTAFTSAQPGIPMNLPGGASPNLTSLGFSHSAFSNLGVRIAMPSSQGIYDVTSVSFAYASSGNGWANVILQMSTDAGGTFTNLSGLIALPPAGGAGATITIAVPSGTTLNINNLVLRLLFTNGASNGNNLQFQLDNIQIGGTIVPEPATVVGGLLGVLGLCWHQRRRLIQSVRFRRT